jgi:aldose 1-epimerase
MTITPSSVELRAGPLRLVIRPDLGGSIAGLWHDELQVLRSAEPAALQSPRDSGGFVLAPYSNRLGFRRFRWLGRDHTTLPNFEGSDHSLHGVAWTRPWQLLLATDTLAELRLRHSADAHWPFDFEVRQRLVLSPAALELQLSLTNTDTHAQPAGLGWHPYFPRRSRSRLHVELTDRWENDASTHLPTRKVPQPGIDGDVAHLAFDNCFEGWRGAARIRDEKLSLKLSSSMPYLVVYTPEQKDYFCVEPVSHVNNAIHMADPAAHGLRNLATGQVVEASVRLEVATV